VKTDAEALAAYFEAWRDGWPLPDGWFRDGDSWMRYGFGGSKRITHDTVLDIDDIDIQALIGTLVVELASLPGWVGLSKMRPEEGSPWLCRVGQRKWGAASPLCVIVLAWIVLEATK
jgi:hypothetical protein